MTLFIRLTCTAMILFTCQRVQSQARTSAELPAPVARARIAHIQATLDDRAWRAQFWQYGWTALGYSATGGFVALAATSRDKDQRLDFAFAAGGAFIDTTVHALGSINVRAAARLREQPDDSPEQLRFKLAIAEAQLAAAAEAESERRSLLEAQILPVGFSLATGLALGVGFGHIHGAVVNTVAAIVINELRVLTQPTAMILAWEAYRHDPDALLTQRAHQGLEWSWMASPLGCGIYGSF